MTPLAWDTEFFGVGIGRTDDAAALDAEIAAARAEGLDLLYVHVPNAERRALEDAVRHGARLVDLRTELDRDGEPPAAPHGTRRAGDGDRGVVEAGARELSATSRFRSDERIGAGRVADMYAIWARRCLDEGVVVVPSDGSGGLVGASSKGEEARLDLVWVASGRAGRGLGRALVDAALAAVPARRARVVTQATNVAALRLYESAGFRTRSVEAILHLWLDEAV